MKFKDKIREIRTFFEYHKEAGNLLWYFMLIHFILGFIWGLTF